jgi:hypothetical protein
LACGDTYRDMGQPNMTAHLPFLFGRPRLHDGTFAEATECAMA